jgi:glycerophosphoryl diester phosphodiesterase
MPLKRPLLLGHRGARTVAEIPENTFASFDLALSHGADGFECDVRRTADGCAVVCHDPHYKGRDIAHTQHDSLIELPQLEEVLVRYGAHAFLDIELKVSGLEETTLSLLNRQLPQAGYVLSSFLPEVLRRIRTLAADVPLGFICDKRADFDRWKQLPVSHLMPHYSLLDERVIGEIEAAGIKVFVWTVDRRDDMLRLVDWGVDAVISDDTELLVRTLRP